jgi:hypothetical protein
VFASDSSANNASRGGYGNNQWWWLFATVEAVMAGVATTMVVAETNHKAIFSKEAEITIPKEVTISSNAKEGVVAKVEDLLVLFARFVVEGDTRRFSVGSASTDQKDQQVQP